MSLQGVNHKQDQGRLAVLLLGVAAACGGDPASPPDPAPPPPVPVSFVALSAPLDMVHVGSSVQLTAVARDARSTALVDRTITWSSSAPAIAEVSNAGLVTGVGIGVATITATSEGRSASLPITSMQRLHVLASDSIFQPYVPFVLRGRGFTYAAVILSNQSIPVVVESDSVMSFLPPEGEWTPCMEPGRIFALEVRTPIQDRVLLQIPAIERPYRLGLAQGGHGHIPETAIGRCRIQFDSAGEYLAAVYSRQRVEGGAAQPSDSTEVVVQLDLAADAPPAVPFALYSATTGLAQSLWPDADLDHVVLEATTQQASSCPLPGALGGAIQVYTRRDAEGRVANMAAVPTPGATLEDWTMVGIGETIAVFFDSTTVRIMGEDPSWAAVPAYLVALADTAAIPFVNAVTRGIPDKDGNGKLVVYVFARFALASFAAPYTGVRAGCGASEAIGLRPSSSGTDDLGFRFPPSVFVHELGHIVDIGWADRTALGRWASEGYANFVSALYLARAHSEPLSANRSTFHEQANVPSLALGGTCIFGFEGGGAPVPTVPSVSFRDAPNGNGYVYSPSCNLVSYLAQLRQARTGEGYQQVATAWSHVPSIKTLEEAVTSFVGLPEGTLHVMGDWLLSWFADEQVQGTGAELQQKMWSIPGLLAGYGYGLPEPDATLSPALPAVSFKLGAPDARFLRFNGPASSFLDIRRLTNRAPNGLAILRVQ